MAILLRPTFLRLGLNTGIVIRRLYCTPSNEVRKGLVLGAYSTKGCVSLSKSAAEFDSKCSGKLSKLIHKAQGKEFKKGKTCIFYGLNDFDYVAVVGLGDLDACKDFDDLEMINEIKDEIRKSAAIGCKALKGLGATKISVETFGDPQAAAEGSILSVYKFQEYKVKKEPEVEISPFSLPSGKEACWKDGEVKATAQNLARTLMNTPGNLMTPTIFAETVKNKLEEVGVKVTVHDEQWAREKGMNSFLSVAQGSEEPPKFLEICYSKGSDPPCVLVGKGVTFDSGGISIKPSLNMDHMKADMGGAATVASAIYGLAKLNVPVNVVGLIPLTENMPSGKATKPGDVFKAMNGKSIAVDNTDAEGRLILADALCYSACFKPKFVLDIATLTGAMVVALGNAATGVFSNSNKLYSSLEQAAADTGDRIWRFPLWKHYTKQVTDFPAVDVNNVGKEKGGGSATAAAFLREFVPEKTEWIHMDMASVMGPGDKTPYIGPEGMTGRPTRTLIEFIDRQSCKSK